MDIKVKNIYILTSPMDGYPTGLNTRMGKLRWNLRMGDVVTNKESKSPSLVVLPSLVKSVEYPLILKLVFKIGFLFTFT